MAELNDFKDVARDVFKQNLISDIKELYDPLTLQLAAMGILPNSAEIKANLQSLADKYFTHTTAVEEATSNTELKEAAETALKEREDGSENSGMFGTAIILNVPVKEAGPAVELEISAGKPEPKG